MLDRHEGTEGVCRLCGLDAPLRHSHIIPRFMFRPMSRLSNETPMRFGSQEPGNRPGHLKERLLCESCEQRFSSYEGPASAFLRTLNEIGIESAMRPIRQTSLDYGRLKLFFLSLLWRCAVCADGIVGGIVGRVDLGPRRGPMTSLLLEEDPGAENEFPVFLPLVAESEKARNAVLAVPEPVRRDGRKGYQMYGFAVEVSWIVDKRGASREDRPHMLRSDGSWLVETVRGADCPIWARAVANAHESESPLIASSRT